MQILAKTAGFRPVDRMPAVLASFRPSGRRFGQMPGSGRSGQIQAGDSAFWPDSASIPPDSRIRPSDRIRPDSRRSGLSGQFGRNPAISAGRCQILTLFVGFRHRPKSESDGRNSAIVNCLNVKVDCVI
jgi:hypothetical protein